jgi:putative ABC transport system permease protein
VLFEGQQIDQQPSFLTGSEVTPEYFHLLGIGLHRGRLFTDFDTDSTPSVAVINESMARVYWPNEEPIGKRLKLSPRATVWTTVIGIVADARTDSLARDNVPQVYASLYQRQGKHLAILVRGHLRMSELVRGVRGEIQSINAALPVFGAETLDDAVSAALAVRRLSLRVMMLFAVTAIVLAGLGLYGVVSFMVNERTHEIAVRVALGAQHGDIARMIVQQGVGLIVGGTLVGLAGALIVARAMSGMLFGVSPFDLVTFGAMTAVLVAVALAGCYLPARRALRMDALAVLR